MLAAYPSLRSNRLPEDMNAYIMAHPFTEADRKAVGKIYLQESNDCSIVLLNFLSAIDF